MPGAGQLRSRVKLQMRTQTPDGGTGITESFSNLAGLWAQVITIKGSQRIDSVNASSGPSHRFRVRYRDDIDASQFLVHNGRRFRILDVENENEADRYLDLLCEEIEEV